MRVESGIILDRPHLRSKEADISTDAVYGLVKNKAYSLATVQNPEIRVTPDSRYCWYVNQAASQILREEGFSGAYLKHKRHEDILHTFIAVDDPQKEVLDYQFQQFVLEDVRDALPAYMRISYKTEADVRAGLIRHNIPEKYHAYWLEELDWSGRFPDPYPSPIYASTLRPPDKTF